MNEIVNNGGEKQNRGEDRGHRLIVSREEMEAAAEAFDERQMGCDQGHDVDFQEGAWRAALEAAHEVRLRRLADEAERGFSPEQIGEPRPGPGASAERLGDYVQGLVQRAEQEAFADGQAYERMHATHDHDPDTCLECEDLDEAAFQRGQQWEQDEVGTVGPRHGPRHVGWDRVIEALSGAVDEAIIEAVRDLRALEDTS